MRHKTRREVTKKDLYSMESMMKEGKTVQEMAERLYLSSSTVGVYTKEIRRRWHEGLQSSSKEIK